MYGHPMRSNEFRMLHGANSRIECSAPMHVGSRGKTTRLPRLRNLSYRLAEYIATVAPSVPLNVAVRAGEKRDEVDSQTNVSLALPAYYTVSRRTQTFMCHGCSFALVADYCSGSCIPIVRSSSLAIHYATAIHSSESCRDAPFLALVAFCAE